MTLNDVQKNALRSFIRGEPIPTIFWGNISSGGSPPCSVCGGDGGYPTLVGVGAAAQVFREPEKYAVICKTCEGELKREHFRRTTYEELFK